LIGTPRGNVIEQNAVSGNTNGIYIAAGAVDSVVRENVVVGNPGIQSANINPTSRALDIVNLAPEGQTKFERNVCATSLNAPCPAVTPRHSPPSRQSPGTDRLTTVTLVISGMT
jgi:parallel beta-helix repeat protein